MTEYQPRKGGSYKRDKDGNSVLVARTQNAPKPEAAPSPAPAQATPSKPTPAAKSDAPAAQPSKE